MQLLKRKLAIETERLTLRPPVHADFRPWATLRSDSITYLTPWEPSWEPGRASRRWQESWDRTLVFSYWGFLSRRRTTSLQGLWSSAACRSPE